MADTPSATGRFAAIRWRSREATNPPETALSSVREWPFAFACYHAILWEQMRERSFTMPGKRLGRHVRNGLDAKGVGALIRKGKTGRHFDGEGLHLLVKSGGSASWVLRVSALGKRRDYGLGGADVVSLAQAREKAREWRSAAKAGDDPVAERKKARAIPTFAEVARSVHADHKGAWKNSKHSAQWLQTLTTYAFPEIGSVRVDALGVPEVLRVLQPIWLTKPETARRLRQRIRTVLDVARAAGYREGENPVGPVLAKALPRQSNTQAHHAALPYSKVPSLFARLGEQDAGGETSRLALQLLILSAGRTGEILGARRSEFDLPGRVWTIPAERMKAHREHRIPLSDAAVAAVTRSLELSTDPDLLFPGMKRGRPLSNMALLMLLRRLGVDATSHGFRSSFRDWVAEASSFPGEIAEMALAHVVGDKTQRAYARSDLFDRRRELMAAWGQFVTVSANVVALKPRKQHAVL